MDSLQKALNQTLAHSDSVFGTQNRFNNQQFAVAPLGLTVSLRIYTWPKKTDTDTKLAVLSYLTAHGRSESESPTQWASWLLTYVCLCFEEFTTAITAETTSEYTFASLPTEYITAVSAAVKAAEEEDGSEPESLKDYEKAVHGIPQIKGFPEIESDIYTYPPDLSSCRVVEAVYGYCSLLLFLSGKKINEKNRVTITERRPQNLIDTYGIHETATYFLTGEGKMNNNCHTMGNLCWTKQARARLAIVKMIATFGAGRSMGQRVVYTVTKLLEHSGMQQARSIHNFLQAYPQAATYSCIRAALNAYAISIREVAQAPPHLQPYYKLMYGENTRVFHRASILPLAACAITYEKNFTPTLANFTLGDGAPNAIAMFENEARSRGHKTLAAMGVDGSGVEEIE